MPPKLPLPIRFGYHQLVAREFVKELRRRDLLRYFDAIVLFGSSVQPVRKSVAKDIDIKPFLRRELTHEQKLQAGNAYQEVMHGFEREYGVSFEDPELPWGTSRKDRFFRFMATVYTMTSVAIRPHIVLHASPDSRFLELSGRKRPRAREKAPRRPHKKRKRRPK